MNDLLTGVCTVGTPTKLLRTPSGTSPEREQVIEAVDAHLQMEHKQADVGQLLKLLETLLKFVCVYFAFFVFMSNLGQSYQGIEGGLRQGWHHG